MRASWPCLWLLPTAGLLAAVGPAYARAGNVD